MAVACVPEEGPDFLRSCLVEGDPVQEARVRRSKRRALLFSIIFQILLVAGLVLFPLFTKGENIANRPVLVPTIPYSPGRAHPEKPRPTEPSRGTVSPCRFCPPPSIPTKIFMHDSPPIGEPGAPDGPWIPGVPEGPVIPGLLPTTDLSHQPPPPVARPHSAEHRRISEPVIAAKLVRRVEPVYPSLAVQIRREGRVELHAIIATDGTIQSLEVVTGDPLFIQSALAAVRDWRYQPTILDGQPVEVDTHITVIYSLAH